ncbi:MAG TPA: xylulokinase [Actinomycetota bacterium]|nr:xylulokinase [Actinomycetota bacterium]
MTVTIGVDVGTTGAQAVAVDEEGRVVATASSEYPLLTPRPQWTEQDPARWWEGVREVLSSATRDVEGAGRSVAGVGLTGQMHGSVFLDAGGEVIRPALLWNDQRTGKQCQEITEAVGERRLVEITGNPALTGFQAPKVLWLRDEEPDAFARVEQLLLPKDYIRYRLSGRFATDASDAAGTLFLDLERRTWSAEILDALGVPASWFPDVFESPEPAGSLAPDVADELGLPADIPIAAGGGDNAAAAIGTGITRDGLMSSSIGTSGVLFAHADAPAVDPSGRIHAFCHAVPGKDCLLAVVLSAGGSLRWWRDVTGADYDALVAEARDTPPGAEGLVFLPYLTGERTPHLDPLASGVFLGLTARHTRGHMTRALMEGVLFALRDGLEIMRELGVRPKEIRATGGGATSELWLHLQADVYGLPVHRLEIEEGAAYGAALLGHVAAGTFADVNEASSVVRTKPEVTEPDPRTTEAYDALHGVYRSVYASLCEDMHRLAELAGP